jgi:hypothetical protein
MSTGNSDRRMRWVFARFIPRLLTDSQMEYWKTIASELCEMSTQDSSFLVKVVTGNKSWVLAYDPET